MVIIPMIVLAMFPLSNTLFFVLEYVKSKLSKSQVCGLGFILSAIIVSNTICWAVFERISNKKHKSTKLMGMFRRAKLPWDKLIVASIHLILKILTIKLLCKLKLLLILALT